MPPRSKREHLQTLVDSKRRWSRELTDEERALGFLGWHERGYLPHCDFPNLIQLITFRLADSMPEARRSEWSHLLTIEDNREKRTKIESYLDLGHGACLLRPKKAAKIVESALLSFHGTRYELLAWVIMPNHVHVLVHIWTTPMSKLVQSWKRFSATRTAPQAINSDSAGTSRRDEMIVPNRSSALRRVWQQEYWDTIMHDEKQCRSAVRYIESNPVKAHLCREPKDWPPSSARYRDHFNHLTIPSNETAHVSSIKSPTLNAPNRSSALR